MDKLQPILANIKKYQFWVLCGLVLVVSLVCWWLSTGDMARRFNERKAAIDSSFSSAVVQPNPPNQSTIEYVQKCDEALKHGDQGVYPAWEVLYQQQQEKNLLPKELPAEFKKAFQELKPGGELASKYCEMYQNCIKSHISSLKDVVKALKPLNPASAAEEAKKQAKQSSLDREAHPEDEWTGVVEWDDGDYHRWEERFQWDLVPTTTAVVLAQEDFWVCEAVLRAIARTNLGANNQAGAAVKRIELLQIGGSAAEAARAYGGIVGLDSAALPATPPTIAGAGGLGASPPGGGASSTGPTDEQIRKRLLRNRYVDEKGMSLPYDASLQPLYVKHPFAEFKIMPVFMKLVVNETRLPNLLVECANSRMPIEVRRMRIIGPAAGRGPTATPAGGGVAASSNPGGLPKAEEPGRLEVLVEIHAVIYIFNPPDREKLGKGAVAGNPPGTSIGTGVGGR